MNTAPTHAPLVATNTDEAADLMVSEGAPLSSGRDFDTNGDASRRTAPAAEWQRGVYAPFQRQPWTVLGGAFGLGFAAAWLTPR